MSRIIGGLATALAAVALATPTAQAVERPFKLVENGKLNAEEMLNEVAQLFVERNGCTIRTLASKKNASAPAKNLGLPQVPRSAAASAAR